MAALGISEGGEERHDRPPVHYQISVTGRQAAFFFLLLLAALGLAFFFGMKTGAAARQGPGAVATLAAASDLPVPTLAPSESPREEKKPAEEALGFAADKRVALKEAAGAATPAPASTAVPSPKPPAPTAAPPTKEAPAKASPPKTASAKAAPKGPFWVQVLATKKAQTADDLMKRLKDEGFAADISAVPGKDGWFRVRVGPFKDRSKAEAMARKIKVTDKQIKNTPLVVP
jgi:cell division septation protein DedD